MKIAKAAASNLRKELRGAGGKLMFGPKAPPKPPVDEEAAEAADGVDEEKKEKRR